MPARLAVLLILVVPVCRPDNGGAEARTDDDAPSEHPAPPTADLDRLRSLGYVDYAPQPVAGGKTGTILWDAERSTAGYFLYTSRSLRMAELIDATGRLVRSWSGGSTGRWVRSILVPNGDLLVLGAESLTGDDGPVTNDGRYVMRLDWDGRVIWKRRMFTHHDIAPAPDDRLMLLTFRHRRIPAVNPDADVRDDHITIISQKGELLDERSLYDMLTARADLFTFQPVKPSRYLGRWHVDIFHANSIEWMSHQHLEAVDAIYDSRNVLVSIRHQDTIAIFNWEKGEVVWAWGQGFVSGPHDATVLDNGHILLFDNGLARKWSRVIELDPLTRKIVWEYKAPTPTDFHTLARGANQRLPNGNTLITNSDSGQAFEVTPDGERVWEYHNPHVNDKGRCATMIRLYRMETSLVERLLERKGS